MTPLCDHLAPLAAPGTLIDPDESAPYLTEWRGRWQGRASAIVAPASVEELSRIMRFCHDHEIAMTPQGGNTGLVGGQVPHGEVLILTKRLRKIREVSPANNSLTVEAGVTLAETQAEAEKVDRLFPLSIGSEGSCQIGGNISSNAGGVNVLRYGNMRDLVLGLEVVLPNGEVWNGLNSLRKNNTGYDLKQLFIGAEGTLGIVTAACLKLFPRPRDRVTVFASLDSPAQAVDLLGHLQSATAGQASSFEIMSGFTADLVTTHIADRRLPVAAPAPWYVIAEFTSGEQSGLGGMVERALEAAFERDLVTDAVIARNETQAAEIWALRHDASDGMKRDGRPCAKCDVSVPIHQIPAFLTAADEAVLQLEPAARIVAFGHIGDGNIHYDILGPVDREPERFRAQMASIEHAVHDVAVSFGGSISAEHGIGTLKRDEMRQRKSAIEMAMMDAVKRALDPKGLMNPGKVL